jgi:hypothetical protein
LKKNKDVKVAKVFLRGLSAGLEQRYNILRAAKADVKPKLTRGDSILGTRGITPGDKVDEASSNCTRMMKEFPDNEKVQYFGAKAIRYLARLAKSAKDNLNKAGVGKFLNDALTMPWRMSTHQQQLEALYALAEDDPEAVETLSKQSCLTSIMDCLAAHDGDPELIESAKPLIKALAENKDEVAKLKNQLEFHMGRLKDYVEDPASDFENPTEEKAKDGETSNVLCGIYMMLPDLAVEGTEKDIIKILKDFWEKKNPVSEKVRPKKIGGKKKDKLIRSIDGLCNAMINIKDHAKTLPDEDMKKRIVDAEIMPEIWKSFYSLNDIPHQALQHAKLLEMCAEDEPLLVPLVESAKANDAVASLNLALDKHAKDPEIMGEVIPLALLLCEKSPDIAAEIDTRALIPILLDEGRELTGKVGDN